MICTKCNFDNKEGAVFCAQCGAPLTAPVEEKLADAADEVTIALDDVANKAEAAADDFGGQTTVLTSNAALDEIKDAKDKAQEAPSFVAPTPAPMPGMPAGQPMPGAPMMKGQASMGQPMPGAPATQPMNGAPMMNGQAPMGQPMPGAPMMNGAPNGKPEKAPKPPKAPKEPKMQEPGAMKTGAKVYIVISIILILGLIGTGVWGFLHFTKEVDNLKKDKSNLGIELADANEANEELASSLDADEATISSLKSQVDSLNEACDAYENQISTLEESAGEYSTYDPLISFAKGATGQGYDDFFVSDTVVHLTGGEIAVKLYFAHEGEVMYTVDDTSVATCEWSDSFENNIASLYITPNGSGSTEITITNSVNDEEITIYVFVD